MFEDVPWVVVFQVSSSLHANQQMQWLLGVHCSHEENTFFWATFTSHVNLAVGCCWTCACQEQDMFVGQANSKATQILARNNQE